MQKKTNKNPKVWPIHEKERKNGANKNHLYGKLGAGLTKYIFFKSAIINIKGGKMKPCLKNQCKLWKQSLTQSKRQKQF